MIASVAATTQAMTLAQSGITKALIVTSQASATRNSWTTARSENTATATVVKGFTEVSAESIEKGSSRRRLIGAQRDKVTAATADRQVEGLPANPG